jgi:prepilin-type N-terminal cleavage/methylation domain-containing protein
MRAKQAGFSLIEVLIALTILALVGASVGMVLQRTQNNFVATTGALEQDVSGSTALRRIRETLRSAALGTATPRLEAPMSSPFLEFQRDPSGTGAWNDIERIEWRLVPGEIDDGLDNNGNGMRDEGRVVWLESFGLPEEREHVLVSNVSEIFAGEAVNGADDNGNGLNDEPGLCFNFAGESLTIRLSLEKRDLNGHQYASAFQSGLHLRN